MCTRPVTIRNPFFSKSRRIDRPREYYELNHLLGSFITVPCGKCLECAKKRQNEWFLRLYLHSLKYDPKDISFITLTYNPHFVPETEEYIDFDTGEYLPSVTTLYKPHFQKFMKKLRLNWEVLHNPTLDPRKSDDRKNSLFKKCNLTYFACGEYGSHTQRSHLHLLLFGSPPSEARTLARLSWTTPSHTIYDSYSSCVYESPKMESSPLGFVYVDNSPAGSGSLRYVAKYCTKYKCRLNNDDDVKDLHDMIHSLDVTDVEKDFLEDNIFFEYAYSKVETFVGSFRLCSQGIGSNITDYPSLLVKTFDTVTNTRVINPYFYVPGYQYPYLLPRYCKQKLYSEKELYQYSLNNFIHREIDFNNKFLDHVRLQKQNTSLTEVEIKCLPDYNSMLLDFETLCNEQRENRERELLVSFLQDYSKDASQTF